jgi:hypothetical protein
LASVTSPSTLVCWILCSSPQTGKYIDFFSLNPTFRSWSPHVLHSTAHGGLFLHGISGLIVKQKVNQSHYRPGQALRVPESWDSQISRQSAHESGKVVSPTHRPPLPPGNILVLISFTGKVNPRAIVRPQELCQWKIPITPSRIEPATFWLVAQCLNGLSVKLIKTYHTNKMLLPLCFFLFMTSRSLAGKHQGFKGIY